MSDDIIKNGMPRFILRGFQDNSTTAPVPSTESLPQHLPHIFTFAPRGQGTPELVSGAAEIAKIWGDSIFDYKKPYTTHQTPLLELMNLVGNKVMLQRLIPDDAKKALLRLSLEVIPNQVMPKYEREDDGTYVRDANGAPIQVVVATVPQTVTGVKYVWHLNYAGTSNQAFGQAQVLSAVYPRADVEGEATDIYPIMDLEVSFEGEAGNRIGLRIAAPTGTNANPTLMQQLKQFIYRFQAVERPEKLTTPRLLQTNMGEVDLNLVFEDETYNPTTDAELSLRDLLVQSYQDLNPTSGPRYFGPFGRVHLYDANITTVQNALFAAEAAAQTGNTADWVPVNYTDATNAPLMNILTGYDFNGIPYEVIRRGDVTENSVVIFDPAATTTLYAAGGDDGDISPANFDLLVREQFDAYGEIAGLPLENIALYPHSIYYDTGFTMETKRSMPKVLGLRPDLTVVLGTHATGVWNVVSNVDVYTPVTEPLSASDEASVAAQLNQLVANYPESTLHGTPACRAAIVRGSFKLVGVGAGYRHRLPLTLEVAYKMGRYMGASTGAWNGDYKPDVDPLNKIERGNEVSGLVVKNAVAENAWSNNAIYFQPYDHRDYFCAAFQSVCPDDTSIFNSLITVLGATWLHKVCFYTWRGLTGRTDLSDDQFIEQSNKAIERWVSKRFDDRFVIQAETYYTPADTQRGFSWSAKIRIYANNMKTVAAFQIEGNRMSALTAA